MKHLTPEKALTLIELRRASLNARAAAPHFSASAAWSAAAERSPEPAPPAKGSLARVLDGMIRDLQREASVRCLIEMSEALAALASDPCEVARWNIQTFGYRLPLP